MRNKCYLPASMEEIQNLPQEKLEFYWNIFYPTPTRNKKAMFRPLWYAIQCERFNLKLEDKYITRLNRYANNPEKYIQKANKNKYNLSEGTEIIKIYKEKKSMTRIRIKESIQRLESGSLFRIPYH